MPRRWCSRSRDDHTWLFPSRIVAAEDRPGVTEPQQSKKETELLMRISKAGILALTLLTAACSWRDTTFTLVFHDADGLRQGQFLVLKGVRVGEVAATELANGQAQVEARVYRKYVNAVCAESGFLIEKPGGFMDSSGDRQITVTPGAERCTPIKAGAILQGQDSVLETAATTARDLAVTAWVKAKELADAAATELSKTPLFKDLGAAMRDFGQGAAPPGNAEDQLEAIRKRAKALRDELEKTGRSTEARALWDRFEQWYGEARRALPQK
jgi:hypothetical protein